MSDGGDAAEIPAITSSLIESGLSVSLPQKVT